jgi:hypothetical protein
MQNAFIARGYTGQFKKKVTLSHVYNEVTSEPTITRHASIVRIALKVLICYLTNTQCGNPCQTAHVNPIVHFCPDTLQHVPVYGCHSGDDSLSQFLKIIWQGWYMVGGSVSKRVRNSRCTVVTELVFTNCRIQNAFCCVVAILQHGLSWRLRLETLSRVNYLQT